MTLDSKLKEIKERCEAATEALNDFDKWLEDV